MSSERPTLTDLEAHGDFVRRHIGPGEPQIAEMLTALGQTSLDALQEAVVPANIVSDTPLELRPGMSEREALTYLRRMRERNEVFVSMLGMGYYGTILPAVIKRNVLENPGWYTAYTPYQSEVSQGRLEVLLNFQQMVIDLTGMDIANASLLDEGTAAAEAMAMSARVSKSKSRRFLVDHDCHPQTLAVLSTRAAHLDIELEIVDLDAGLRDTGDCFGVFVQYPGSSGEVRDFQAIAAQAHANQALVTVASDLLALTLLKAPGTMGADIVVGSAQRFGVPMGYGGPHAAFFATRDAYKRSTPGRIIGVSVDASGRTALRMALQTREQHIRREKATSNICTAQVLLAVIAALYAIYHGPDGLLTISRRVARLTAILRQGLTKLGIHVDTQHAFDTLTVRVPGQAARYAAKAREARINLRIVDADTLGISFDETTRRENLTALWAVFGSRQAEGLDLDALDATVDDSMPAHLRRDTPFMEHPVFHRYHGETEMLRYLRWLASRDIALDRAMIPLGSCTMKLNSTTEMTPVTYRQFSALHPFAPLDQTQGYQQLFEELEEQLCAITGFHAVSLQPNAGSQGEYAGLLCIAMYHRARGEGHRDVCLIPSSAHGTNPASAVMAGMRVVMVACDDEGNVDVDDLRAKATTHANELAALMITYPSTHGVFEAAVNEICAIVHEHGGQVYMDGANLNALVGICKPAEIGADVSHINLHKTFCIPHGGGGPGMGPIGVREHLAPYLPDHPVVEGVNPASGGQPTVGTVSAAPWGSASILPISWAYIAMMGAGGLKRATQIAILNANYIAHRLKDAYPVLYTGQNGMVAHECIIDFRDIKESTGITVEDVAKRLVDFGFHAPTVSFPVAETMMIEPTESEAMRELDRFCDAMLTIREEIAEVERGDAAADDNVLKHAPHTHRELLADTWERPYSRARAFFPQGDAREDKYWPPVGRVDNVHGDRNLMCTCPPMEAYAEAAE
ncbi:MAG: aminomethyl-transferring glycine dehydrogenase [Pseudomonadota bacterium]